MMQVFTTQLWYCNMDTHPYFKCWIPDKYLPEETELHESGSNYICPELPLGSSSGKKYADNQGKITGAILLIF